MLLTSGLSFFLTSIAPLLLFDVCFNGFERCTKNLIAELCNSLHITTNPFGATSEKRLSFFSFAWVRDFKHFPRAHVSFSGIPRSTRSGVNRKRQCAVYFVVCHQRLSKAVIEKPLGSDRFGAGTFGENFTFGDNWSDQCV